ncbi:MAG: hypothetical protein M0T73_13290 [Deltaproteobacteria bacterium]|nr:hypothetical protein [Deltaproteobacteria bacterium]
MRKINSFFTVVIILVGVILANLGAFVSIANSAEDIAQERSLCVQECHGQNGSGMTRWALASRCVNKCEKRYWEKWNQEMNVGNDSQVAK